MKSQEQGTLSAPQEANRQALTCIAIASLAGCVLIIAFGYLVWSMAPQMYSVITTQIAELSQTTATVLYVSSDGTSWTCDSWENACGLQTALAAATSGDEIWVKTGIYRPTSDTSSPDATFQLKKGVAVYGGFAGTETTRDQRDWETHVTFVANTAGGGGGMYNHASNPTLNDVTFTGNEAIDASCMNNYMGSSPVLNGVVFDGNSSSNKGCMVNHVDSNPTLTDVTFSDNASKYGSGMYNYQSSPTLTDVAFSNNKAGHVGGAMENEDHSNPILTNVLFSGNSANHEGGGMFNTGSSDPILTNVAFINNSVTGAGGGGMNNYNSSPILTNVTFSGNHAVVGGGINNWQSSLTLTNVTFSGNTANQAGAAMFSQESTPTIVNTIIWGNRPADSQMLDVRGMSTATYSIIAGGFPGIGNLNIDPRLSVLVDNGGFTPTYALPSGSPAIDAGSSSICPATDQLGLSRPVDGDGNGSAICDMGASEYQSSD